jgi:hypothetical protein
MNPSIKLVSVVVLKLPKFNVVNGVIPSLCTNCMLPVVLIPADIDTVLVMYVTARAVDAKLIANIIATIPNIFLEFFMCLNLKRTTLDQAFAI